MTPKPFQLYFVNFSTYIFINHKVLLSNSILSMASFVVLTHFLIILHNLALMLQPILLFWSCYKQCGCWNITSRRLLPGQFNQPLTSQLHTHCTYQVIYTRDQNVWHGWPVYDVRCLHFNSKSHFMIFIEIKTKSSFNSQILQKPLFRDTKGWKFQID